NVEIAVKGRNRYSDGRNRRSSGQCRFRSLGGWSAFRIYDAGVSEALSRHCSSIPTTLGRIGRDDALLLLIHAYQNAQPDLFGKLGYPRPVPTPGVDRFAKLFP
ncbi:MAG: hypothetical protein QF893_12925, partial [Alphaproteobacteria bacterium]|nr:hypothetical protein [Alphaproteobacteria bacterium]